RKEPLSVWTGSKMIVWGGQDSSDVFLNSGLTYDPSSDTWSAISSVNAPSGRIRTYAQWSGNEMLGWGCVNWATYFGDWAEFNSWTAITSEGAPSGRSEHVSVWVGDRIVIWSGGNAVDRVASGLVYFP